MKLELKSRDSEKIGRKMDTQGKTNSILAMAYDLWNFHKIASFAAYVKKLTGAAIDGNVRFDCFYLEERHGGNPINGDLFSGSDKSWIVNDTVMWREISNSEAHKLLHMKTIQVSGFELYRVPIIKFFLVNQILILGETYGPLISARKVCHVNFDDGTCRVIDTRIAWTFPG